MKKITALLLSFLIAIAPVYQAHAILPAVGSVVVSVVGATVIDAGVTAAINVVAGKSPWAANDPVYGGQVKTPVKGVANWVKKNGLQVAFWTAALAAADYFIDGDKPKNVSSGRCSLLSSATTFSACFNESLRKFSVDYPTAKLSSYKFVNDKPNSRIIFQFFFTINTASMNTYLGHWSVDLNSAPEVSDLEFEMFTVSGLNKVKPDSEPFTIPPSRYPSFPANDPVWPEKIEPVTPPAKPTKPYPTPVPTPQPSPTPENPLYPSKPDTGRWPLPWPLPGLETIPNPNPSPDPNPDPDAGTEIKPTPDGGFIIPNPLPVEVTNDVNVNVLNLEQGLTAAQLAQRDLRIDNDSAAGLGSPDSLTNDSYFDAFKPIDNMLGNLPSPPSFNFTSGMFGIPSYSSCIPYVFTIPSITFLSMTIPAQSVTIGQHCDYYDANLRPFVAWIFQAIGLLTIYRISVRSTRL